MVAGVMVTLEEPLRPQYFRLDNISLAEIYSQRKKFYQNKKITRYKRVKK